MNNTKTTFWQFLKDNKVEIPIIQRDYAQGRKGKEKLREKFLADLQNALDGKLPNKEKVLKLDFVYGSVENGNLNPLDGQQRLTTLLQFLKDNKIEIPIIQHDYAQSEEKLREKFLADLQNALDTKLSNENSSINPLDGQQRLTTLWLLHWYIAYKSVKLQENKDIFKKFTYETRVSSREFCRKLSEFTVQQPAGTGIVKHITNQTWFFSAWKQDPTIQAMLNMLGGTDVKEKGIDITDGIEELFCNTNNETYNDYWEKLIGDNNNCPIVFYYLPMDDLKLSDDLYIKMNARGTLLTSFENFKADLVGHIKQWEEEDKNVKVQDTISHKISHKLDTTWTDIFWKNKSGKCKIDDIYFAFLNRYFLNTLVTAKNENGFLLNEKEGIKNTIFKTLYGKESDDSNVEYESFDIYKNIQKESLEKLTKILDNFYDTFKDKDKETIDKLFVPNWNEIVDNQKKQNTVSKFYFIPEYEYEYKDKDKITTLTPAQRVVFHAICRYFELIDEQNKYNETTLKQWMRVVWNIVENSNATMIGNMRLIDEIGEYSHKIYSWLADDTNAINSEAAKEQMKEEKEKARRIINNPIENWEEKIIDAETTAFFKGTIRFMFTKGDGNYDWSSFDDRLEKSKKYFDKDGIKEEYKIDITTALIKSLDRWNTQLQDKKYLFDPNAERWKWILTNKIYISPVCRIFDAAELTGIATIDFTSDPSKIKEQLVKEQLLEDGVIKFLVGTKDNRFRFIWNGHYLRPKGYGPSDSILFDWNGDNRNEKLKELLDKEIISDEKQQKIPGNNRLFRGEEIYLKTVGDFEYRLKGKQLQKRNITNKLYEDVKDNLGNSITLDILENYLVNL
jgi:hypothetical protein